jgi:hypothetical protein
MDDREWLADYLGRLEASRQEWRINETGRLKAAISQRQAPQDVPDEQPERLINLGEHPYPPSTRE